MKVLLAFFVTASFSGACQGDCVQGAKDAAAGFMNEYIKQIEDVYHDRTNIPTAQWLQANRTITDGFKSSYKQLIDDAFKADPEMGLNLDPILDAQDYPTSGFIVERCDQSVFVTLKGKEWESFKVVVKVINTPSGWLVDGSGIINIPTSKQSQH